MVFLTVCTENLNPDVKVVEAAEERMSLYASGPLNRARVWGIFIQRSVRSHVVIIACRGLQDPPQVRLDGDP